MRTVTREERIGRSGGQTSPLRGLVSPPRAAMPVWLQAILVAATPALCTLVCWPLSAFLPHAELVMVYLLGVTLAATQLGRMSSAITAVLCAACFDFFFVIPRFNFVPSDLKHLVTVLGLLVVSLVISSLTVGLRQEAQAARRENLRTQALYALSRDLARTPTLDGLVEVAARHIMEFVDRPVLITVKEPADRNSSTGGEVLEQICVPPSAQETEQREPEWRERLIEAARRAVLEGRPLEQALHGAGPAGGQGSIETVFAIAVPLLGARGCLGALAAATGQASRSELAREEEELELFAAQIASSLERAIVEREAEEAKIGAETERLRTTLLSSVSHDLRTPLGTIKGASSALLDDEGLAHTGAGRDLLVTINEEADRLNRLVGNLLQMTRLEVGAVRPVREWQLIEDVIGSALARLGGAAETSAIKVDVMDGLPPVRIDGVLVEQAVINVVENALGYSPADAPVEVTVRRSATNVEITVADRGPGLPPEDVERVFDKFYRGLGEGHGKPGVGLGLAVARGIIEAHEGAVWAENREGGGAVFHILLPLEEAPRDLEGEADLDEDESSEQGGTSGDGTGSTGTGD